MVIGHKVNIRSIWLYGQFLVGALCYLTFYRNYLILGHIAFMVRFFGQNPGPYVQYVHALLSSPRTG